MGLTTNSLNPATLFVSVACLLHPVLLVAQAVRQFYFKNKKHGLSPILLLKHDIKVKA
ncbi:MAG: hypothetical protein HY895_02610 [Deltaproteobacteria bacterium]|nr:hypothetical protein [Deltaproteobacteria bacterium]